MDFSTALRLTVAITILVCLIIVLFGGSIRISLGKPRCRYFMVSFSFTDFYDKSYEGSFTCKHEGSKYPSRSHLIRRIQYLYPAMEFEPDRVCITNVMEFEQKADYENYNR